MPVFSIVTGGDGYKNLKYVITEARPATADGAAAVEEVAVNYGLFIRERRGLRDHRPEHLRCPKGQ